MRANLETLHEKREFLSRTGLLALGVLPASMGITPRTAHGGGCGAETIMKEGGVGVGVAVAGGFVFTMPGGQLPGVILLIVGATTVGYALKEHTFTLDPINHATA